MLMLEKKPNDNVLLKISSLLIIPFLLLLMVGCSGGSGSGDAGSGGSSGAPGASPEPDGDEIVYVRYPKETSLQPFITIPQGEHAYRIAAGADLMLLRPDGSEQILVDCAVCSVMDPFISFDGNTVYYSLIEESGDASASWIYKIRLNSGDYTPVRLTFDDGFDSSFYAGNTTAQHDQADRRGIRDMAPSPLADGRIVFTSNRSGLTAFDPGTNADVRGSIQQLYVMDDHDGSANNSALSNLHRLETGNLHMVQHPFQLKDGRIIFSTWQDAGPKFRYAMTSLFTVHPDGSNLQQFTEPHDHHKNVDHFVTQLANEDVIAGSYYPSFDYGYGILMRYPIDPVGIDFLRGSVEQRFPWGGGFKVSFREFDRKGTETITPHTSGGDSPAPNLSGKYSMPSATINDGLLVAYSTGAVNHFSAACDRTGRTPPGPYLCEALKSGIYLIEGGATAMVTDPATLIKIKDDLNYNEIWPRAVASYQQIYGQERPDLIQNIGDAPPSDSRLADGEAAALVGSSSMYNREPLNDGNPDDFSPSTSREIHDGNWKIEGAEAGVFSNSDIHAVRIVSTPAIPFTKPVSKYSARADWDAIIRYTLDSRLDRVVARFGSLHGERWEILGEFPFSYKGTTDPQGNPDTSWLAKVPAETPFFIQTLDTNGMTIVSELTWRALKSSEKAVDCGGCHAHSVEPLDFSATQAGSSTAITGVANVNDAEPIIQNGLWDLTQGKTPLLADIGVTLNSSYSYGVEFTRDVLPIINSRCISCHTSSGSGNMLILDGSGAGDAYAALTDNSLNIYRSPQISKYIRVPQARQSLLVWVVWGERLDGRVSEDRDDDLDYPVAHPALSLTDLEKRTIARWVDLGSAVDFPALSDAELAGFRYTDDYQLPVINIYLPRRGSNTSSAAQIGFADAISGIDWGSLVVSYYPVDGSDVEKNITIAGSAVNNVMNFNLPAQEAAKDYILKVFIQDLAGNKNIETVRFRVN